MGGLVADALDFHGLLVEQRQVPAEQVEHARVRLVGLEQAADRVAGARGAVQRAGVAAQARVGVDRLRARHRQQIAAPFVQVQPQAEERLQAAPEAAARAAYALRDRADPPAVGRVEVEDAVGLAVAHRSEHHRLGLDWACHRTRRV